MYTIGIDLGGTNVKAGVVDENYHIISKTSLKTKCPRPAEEVIDVMAEASRMAVEQAGLKLSDISWVGVGSPGTCNMDTGVVEYANNLGFINVPMRQMIKDRLGLECYIQNDGNAAAYGELLAGAGKGCKDFLAITLGTGIGGGIIIDNKIISGHNWSGAEVGHVVITVDGRDCTCGRKGCWEAYASATGLIKTTKEAMDNDKNSLMWEECKYNLDNVSGRTAFEAVKKGDETAKIVVNLYLKYLKSGIISMINIFQPEVLCIGGGISNESEELLMIPLVEDIKRESYSRYSSSQTKIMKAQLGNDAGLIGAAMLGKLNSSNFTI